MKYDKNHALLETAIPGLPPPKSGKVRDVFDLGDTLLMVVTDRISAFDVILPCGVPDKGKVLNQLSLFWLDFLGMKNHLVTADVDQYPAALQCVKDDLRGRSMLVRKVNMVEVECIARGYLTGSGWKEYQKSGTVNGQKLRAGYQNASKLDEVLFTPTTKAAIGDHDEAISYAQTEALVGADLAKALKDATIGLYTRAADYARAHGIIIADTKFEFGRDADGSLILADEVLTPDSSRFWPETSYAVGANPPSLDKQYVRDWLDSIHFNHQPPGPVLPDDVIARTRAIYVKAYEELSGKKLVCGGGRRARRLPVARSARKGAGARGGGTRRLRCVRGGGGSAASRAPVAARAVRRTVHGLDLARRKLEGPHRGIRADHPRAGARRARRIRREGGPGAEDHPARCRLQGAEVWITGF